MSACRHDRPCKGHGLVRARPAWRRRAQAPAQGACLHGICVALVVHPQFANPSAKVGTRWFRPRSRNSRSALLPSRSKAAWVSFADGDRHRLQPRDRAHRRHELRRRNQEGRVRLSQLPSSAKGRPANALFRQRRWRERHRAFFRPFRHRQDHALRRRLSLLDRGRRTWLGRGRRVQFRGRLLRQGDQIIPRGGAANIRDLGAFWHGAGKCRARSPDAQAEFRRRFENREHAHRLSA